MAAHPFLAIAALVLLWAAMSCNCEPIVALFDSTQSGPLVSGSVVFIPSAESNRVPPGSYQINVNLEFDAEKAGSFCGFAEGSPRSFKYHIHSGFDVMPMNSRRAAGAEECVGKTGAGHMDSNFACGPKSAQATCKNGPGGSIEPRRRYWGRESSIQYTCGTKAAWNPIRRASLETDAGRFSPLYLASETAQCEVGDLSGKFGELIVPADATGLVSVKESNADVLYNLPRAEALRDMSKGGIPAEDLPYKDMPNGEYASGPRCALIKSYPACDRSHYSFTNGLRTTRRSIVVHCGEGSPVMDKIMACAGLYEVSKLPGGAPSSLKLH